MPKTPDQPATPKVEERPPVSKRNTRDQVIEAIVQIEEVEALSLLLRRFVEGKPVVDSALRLIARAARSCMRSLSVVIDHQDQQQARRHARKRKR